MKLFFHLLLFLSSILYAQPLHAEKKFTNALIEEDSPYLQQHVHNPVNWYPWNKETLAKAKREHKLIFLSIGYSTCHWCHVMAHESFENGKIAALMNKDYIAIKVDREELPHLDKYYQNIHILLKKRSGGWPLTAVLTEEAKPFFVGTYFPVSDTYNIEGMDSLLPRLAKAYKEEKSRVFAQALKIEEKMKITSTAELMPIRIDLSIKDDIFKGLQKQFDEVYYGFSRRPKFPESSKISLLFDLDALDVKGAREMALNVLRAIALRGLYDQVEGGFFRYSVDAAWEIPHFEKMLYTNAELIPLFVKAYSLTGDKLYKDIVDETIFMIEERFGKRGVYYSASDADTRGQEGGYFIYRHDEIQASFKGLNVKEREKLAEVLDLSEEGNFEGYTHINFYDEKRPESFEKIRPYLKNIRRTKPYPFIDKKVNTAWNAMMIEALFSASVLDERYHLMAEENMQSLLDKLYIKGVLYHQVFADKTPRQKALLEDYAFLISALLEGYEKNLNEHYLILAKTLSAEAVKKFYDGKFWYLNEGDFPVHADMLDKYYKAPVNKLLMALLQVSALSGEREYLNVVQASLQSKSGTFNKTPAVFASAMQVLLREKRGYVVIKAKKELLMQNKKKIKKALYPFVLQKTDNDIKGYLACDMRQCFALDKDLDPLIKSINKR